MEDLAGDLKLRCQVGTGTAPSLSLSPRLDGPCFSGPLVRSARDFIFYSSSYLISFISLPFFLFFISLSSPSILPHTRHATRPKKHKKKESSVELKRHQRGFPIPTMDGNDVHVTNLPFRTCPGSFIFRYVLVTLPTLLSSADAISPLFSSPYFRFHFPFRQGSTPSASLVLFPVYYRKFPPTFTRFDQTRTRLYAHLARNHQILTLFPHSPSSADHGARSKTPESYSIRNLLCVYLRQWEFPQQSQTQTCNAGLSSATLRWPSARPFEVSDSQTISVKSSPF